MRPAGQRGIAVAGHLLALLLVQREGKVPTQVDDHLKALVVNQRPRAHVAYVVGGDVGKVQFNVHWAGLAGKVIAVFRPVRHSSRLGKKPNALNVLVGAVGGSVSRRQHYCGKKN